jgi:hypothetical protein
MSKPVVPVIDLLHHPLCDDESRMIRLQIWDGKRPLSLPFVPPITFIHAPPAPMYRLRDALGREYWFNLDGSFDGTGCDLEVLG